MFKKKKQAGLLPGQDAHQLLEAMDKIAMGILRKQMLHNLKIRYMQKKSMQCCTHLRMPIIRL